MQQPTAQVMPTAVKTLSDTCALIRQMATSMQICITQLNDCAAALEQGQQMASVFDQVHQRLIANGEMMTQQLTIMMDGFGKIMQSGEAGSTGIAQEVFARINQLTQ